MHTPAADPDLSLSDLVAVAAAWLARADLQLADERVSAVPDARTVRYYQSTGLVDKPREYLGRKAIYGRRHVLQVVCVKLLQARGFKLAQIQTALAGATNSMLEASVAEAIPSLSHGAPTVQEPVVEPTPSVQSAPASLKAFQLAPGVVLSVDPALVADPDALARFLHRHLSQRGST